MKKEDLIEEILDFEDPQILAAILYGSDKKDSDIDIFVVLKERSNPVSSKIGRLDYWSVSFSEAIALSRFWDPLIVEPIYTGTILLDRDDTICSIKKILEGSTPSSESQLHLACKSMEAFQEAFAATYLPSPNHFQRRAFWSNLLFCVTYHLCSINYNSESLTPYRSTDLVNNFGSEFQKVWPKWLMYKTNAESIDRDSLVEFFKIKEQNKSVDTTPTSAPR